jgi:hypothetical protein
MQIAKYFKEEWRMAGLSLREALRRSSKAEEEVAGSRRRFIARLAAMRTEVRKIVRSLVRQPLAGEPLVNCIDDLAAEVRLLQRCCTADRPGEPCQSATPRREGAAQGETRG